MPLTQNKDSSVKPKAILITGANQRLGFEFAKEALRLGYAVIIHYHSRKEPALSWLKRHPEFQKRAWFIQADLQELPQELLHGATELPVRLEGLVNNASVFTKGDLNDFDHFQSVLQINCFAALQLATAFGRGVKKGWIINITDAHIGSPNRSFQNYRISKELLSILTRQLAYLLAPSIRVNAIAPGAMLAARGREKDFALLPSHIPLQRTGSPLSLTQAFDYLVRNEYVTGETLHVDGGWHVM
jgi:NAD(P)-dependent dehydrogenase (short-subunit alcohol dehydrogenase family)